MLGGWRRYLIAAAALGYYRGYWSSWIVGELVRKRTEWIAERALREGCDRTEMRRRLRASRQRLNLLIDELSSTLVSIDYTAASTAEFEWLVDRDDWPVMQTALAADATVLVTDNSVDFPLGESRNGGLVLGAETFLNVLYGRFEDSQTTVEEYLAGTR